MSLTLIGILGIAVLILLFVIGVPVGFAMALVGFVGFSYLVSADAGLSMLGIEFFDNFGSYYLTVVPMFVLMGSVAFEAGISGRLYDAGYAMFGRTRGGLAVASIFACAGFSAICGSTNATAAAMGRVALPEMKRYGYNDSLATGTVASGGSLGILIPPSTLLIIYGILTEQSIGALFIAGVLPGLLLASLFIAAIVLHCWRNPALAPAGPQTTLKEKLAGLAGVAEMGTLFCLVMLGLFSGWFTPTHAGAAGAGGALLIALVRRGISWRGFFNALKDTLLITCMVMVIVTGALIFGRFMAVTKIPFILSDWIAGLPIPPIATMAVIMMIHFIGGCFMDAFALIVLTVPIVFPVVLVLGFDPIWFGVMIVIICEMGVITPPVGINVYVIKGIAQDVPLETIFRGVLPFVIALIVCTVLLLAFPQIVTFLPSFMTY
jgi:C4-dicarboxylate transporter DctM subunit